MAHPIKIHTNIIKSININKCQTLVEHIFLNICWFWSMVIYSIEANGGRQINSIYLEIHQWSTKWLLIGTHILAYYVNSNSWLLQYLFEILTTWLIKLCVMVSTLQVRLGMPSKKKIAQKVTLEHTGGRGVKKFPFFASSKRGHIFMEGGVKIFLSHVPCSLLCFCFHTI